MFPMRQSMLEVEDPVKISTFLKGARTGYLALNDSSYPYVVPLNFIWQDDCIYFHGASEGRKMELLLNNPHVCFTVSEDFGTLTDPVPAKTDTAYMSVMIFGKAFVLSDIDEATMVMQNMLDKYVPGYFQAPLPKAHVDKYRSSLGSRTAVIKICPDAITAKGNFAEEERKYYPGKTAAADLK
ncbi:pyridoxamine 5'-phosphate oxidase family protein [Bacillus infantis]|uniref:pyridoxamine 5'-phosphate oxidase family protein n=1 Tax=Bacillus infantis TaxID=324767 RepID=UPI00301AA6C9